MPRADVVHKTNGAAKFGIDAQVPGMVFAAINACPVPGAKVLQEHVDELALSGVSSGHCSGVVKLENAVAVVATASFWRAKRALSRLQPEWDVGAAGSVDSEQLSKEYHAALSAPMVTARDDGDVTRKAMPSAVKTFEAIYETFLSVALLTTGATMNATGKFATRPA